MEVAEFLALKYPFGREHEASIQLLFRSFCNNLFIGQFECARASINELHGQQSFLRHSVKSILQKALEKWSNSDNNDNLHPLTWPCFIEYSAIEDNEVQVEKIRKALEFRYLLADICVDCETEIIQEIYALYSRGISKMSLECQSYLTTILITLPLLAIQLINFLPMEEMIFQFNNIVVDAIERSFSDKNRDSLSRLLAESKLDLATDGTKDRLEVIFTKIITACVHPHDTEPRWFSLDELNTAVASRVDTELYALVQQVRRDLDLGDERSKMYNKWMYIALDTVSSQRHFFDVIMSKANKHIKVHNYIELVELLDTVEWRPLLPVIFHLAWRQCSNSEESHRLITEFSKVNDSKLKALIAQHQRIDVIEQSLSLSSDKKRQPAGNGMLSVANCRSVLHALLMCLDDLNSWSHQRMMQTLTAKSAYALLKQSENEVSDSDSLSIEQQRDINLFNAFFIINSVMQALCKVGEEDCERPLSYRYKESVLPLLITSRKLLSDMHPLTLKLEVLEDLYILLFSTGSDVKTQSESLKSGLTLEAADDAGLSEDEKYYSAKEAFSPVKPLRPKSLQPSAIYQKKKSMSSHSAAESRLSSGGNNTAGDSPHTATVGFLANEFITRDILTIIKKALTDLTASHFEISNDSELKSAEKELSLLTLTSVTDTNFMSKSSQLQQRVSEALWRYQLILQDSVDKEFGTTVIRSVGRDHSLDDEGFAVYERSLYSSSRKSPSPAQRLAESGPESEPSSELLTYSSGANNNSNLSKNKKYRKHKNRHSSNAAPSKQGIISRMLSSPISLLNMCIKRQGYAHARDVLKLFNLEKSVEGKAFHFEQSYKQFVRQLSNQDRPRSLSANKSRSLTGGVDLSFIRQAAANSLSMMSESTKAEQLSMSAVLPAGINLKEAQVTKFFGSASPRPDIAAAMVLLDLSCVATTDPQLCQQLLSSAQKYIQSSTPHDRKSTLAGMQNWLKQCMSINELALSSDPAKVKQLLIHEQDNLSVRSCLLSSLLNMENSEVRERVMPLLDICNDVNTIERAVAAWRKSGKREPLMATLPIKSLIQTLGKHYAGEKKQYLSDMYEQMQLLDKAITDNTSTHTTGSAASHFSVLEDGPTMIMGRLIFDNHVEPSKLERVAEKVKLDLTHVIVRSCCPPIRCKPRVERKAARSEIASDRFGYRIVLNASPEEEFKSFKLSPLDTVYNALNMLLTIVEGTLELTAAKLLTKDLAEDVKEKPDYATFCLECKKLQQIDLALLSTDKEKRAFFINLHNMLSLHAVIECLSSENGRQYTESSISNILAFQLRSSYVVGQLCICSIFELQQFLLKASCKVRQLDLSMEHPWFCYSPEYSPLTVFLLYDGSLNFLRLKCVKPETVEADIKDAVAKYMKQVVVISPHTHEITIPEVLIQVRSELFFDVQGETIPQYEYAEVLLWILEYQQPKRWSEMSLIMDKLRHQQCTSSQTSKTTDDQDESVTSDTLASVVILPANHKLGFSVDTRVTLHELCSPDDANRDEMAAEYQSSYKLTHSEAVLHKAKFKISDEAVQYVRETSPVVAMLLDIIHEDMLLHGNTETQTSHFDSETLHRDYTHLYQYLEEYILPLCTYIDEEIKSVHQMAEVDIPPHIKAAILTHKSYKGLENSARQCLDALCLDDKFGLVDTVIKKLMALTPTPLPEWLALHDFALIQCAAERVSNESLACIKRLRCERLQAHVAISCLHKSRWTVEKCLLILPLCERRLADKGDNSLVPHLKTIIERMSAFHRIMLHAQAKQDMDIEGCPAKIVQMLASGWQNVAELLVEQPSSVFHLLFDAQEFKFAERLTDMRKQLDNDMKLLVYKRYMVSCLDSNADVSDVTDTLTSLLRVDIDWCFKLCIQVLHELERPGGMLVVTQFIMSEMVSSLGEKQGTNVQLCHIGVQMLMRLEASSHHQYRSLIFTPLLMFEQLLMNAKISWAEKVLPLLHTPAQNSSNHKMDFTEDINRLLVAYAEKAVDFPILYVSDVNEGVVGNGKAGTGPITSGSPALRTVRALARISSPSKASPLQKALLGSSLRRSSSQFPPSRLSRTTTAPGNLLTLGNEHGVVGSPTILVSPLPEKTEKKFFLPERAPTREEWVPDEHTERCMLCRQKFSMFNRRHHCRRCGQVVCAACSSRTAPVNGRSVRVCDRCYESIFKSREVLETQDVNVQKLREKLSGASSTPVSSPVRMFEVPLPDVGAFMPEWILSADEDENGGLRRDFFYDHAPSVSLCSTILKLYSNEIECGKHMLSLCEKLSYIIKPIRPEAINQEVDYNLVISMMKFLLLNAKLLFVKEHYTDGVGLCEAYSNRVDVLSLLLSDYYLDLPTMEELAKIDNIRRLRDRLMEDERPELALEISTKFGLETTVIWSAWGISSLRKADYTAARDKFSKFLRPPMDKHVQTVAYSSILNDIISTLEGQAVQSNGSCTQASIELTLKALTSNQDLSKTVPVLALDACHLDENLEHVQECLYYLKLYGNHQMMINFYRDHGYWQSAVQHCLDMKCSSEVFINCLFLPAVRDGDLALLEDQLLLIDGSLQKCSSYLTAVCRYLARNTQYHTLYQIQLFTKDFLRAAITCIQMFYLSNAKTYVDLPNRASYLQKALNHYQSYLNPLKGDKLPRPKSNQQGRTVESPLRLTQSEVEIRRHMSTIKLQMDVAKHMAAGSLRRESALTLFGDQQQRTTLASKVILASKTISSGFEIAFRIIQDFQLSYNRVYTSASHDLGERRSYAQIKELVTCIKDSGLCDIELLDKVLLSAIEAAVPSDSTQSKEIEGLIKLLKADNSKIEAWIMCGKLRNAYLLAIKYNSLEVISRIAKEAVRLDQNAVKSICDKYISKQKARQQP